MSTPEQRKRLKAYLQRSHAVFAEWAERGYQYPPPKTEPYPDDLLGLPCGAKTRAGTPCKQTATYDNGRCKWHGGCSTGAKTEEGKKRSAMNGFCPKKKRTHTT
ncbi:MAG: HGGxSTG domain-containing protein [Methylococcaceae bacterium]